jgi:hypothetical protein
LFGLRAAWRVEDDGIADRGLCTVICVEIDRDHLPCRECGLHRFTGHRVFPRVTGPEPEKYDDEREQEKDTGTSAHDEEASEIRIPHGFKVTERASRRRVGQDA